MTEQPKSNLESKFGVAVLLLLIEGCRSVCRTEAVEMPPVPGVHGASPEKELNV
jgi:hypothetical protein